MISLLKVMIRLACVAAVRRGKGEKIVRPKRVRVGIGQWFPLLRKTYREPPSIFY